MHLNTLLLFVPLLALAACGGDSGDDAPSLNLQGLWYNVDQGVPGQLSTPTLILQTGRDIVFKQCDRSTWRLRLEGETLVSSDGTPFSLRPQSDSLLLGRRGASAGEEMIRHSRATAFESGRVALTLPSLPALQATQDVCATKGFVSLTGNGAEPVVSTVTINAPYRGGYAEIAITLPRRVNSFPYSPRAGDFIVRDRAGLLQQPDSSAQVELRSPAFAAVYGQDTVKLSSGTMRVGTPRFGVYTFEGTMSTASGAAVTFSAEVTLERSP